MNLKRIRLSYNAFIENIPSQFGNIPGLELIQLHGNRFSGAVPTFNEMDKSVWGDSSFVADCGTPSDFKVPLECDECKDIISSCLFGSLSIKLNSDLYFCTFRHYVL